MFDKMDDKIQLYNWMKENDIPSPPIKFEQKSQS